MRTAFALRDLVILAWPLTMAVVALVSPRLVKPTTWWKTTCLAAAALGALPGLLLGLVGYLWFWFGDGSLNLVAVPLLTVVFGIGSARMVQPLVTARHQAQALPRLLTQATSVIVWGYVAVGLTLLSTAGLYLVLGRRMLIE